MWGQERTSVVFLGTLHLVFGLGVSQWTWNSPRLAAQRAPAIPLLCLLRAEIIDVWCYTPTPLLNVCFGDLNSDPYALFERFAYWAVFPALLVLFHKIDREDKNILLYFAVLGIKLKALCMLNKCSTIKPHLQAKKTDIHHLLLTTLFEQHDWQCLPNVHMHNPTPKSENSGFLITHESRPNFSRVFICF